MDLTPTEKRIYFLLRGKLGAMVSVPELNQVISCADGMANLRTMIWRMRKKGLQIQNVRGRGYLITMPVFELDIESQDYAQDVQEALHGAMRKYVDTVGFESQIAIIGVAVGAMLNQLPEPDRDHYTKILFKNVREAKRFSQPMRMQ